jgi:hypothetical protein
MNRCNTISFRFKTYSFKTETRQFKGRNPRVSKGAFSFSSLKATNNIAWGETPGHVDQNEPDAEGVEQLRIFVTRLQRAVAVFANIPQRFSLGYNVRRLWRQKHLPHKLPANRQRQQRS